MNILIVLIVLILLILMFVALYLLTTTIIALTDDTEKQPFEVISKYIPATKGGGKDDEYTIDKNNPAYIEEIKEMIESLPYIEKEYLRLDKNKEKLWQAIDSCIGGYVAVDKSHHVCGFMQTKLMKTPTTIFIASLCVSPQHRRKGIARMLINHMPIVAKSNGRSVIRALIHPNNTKMQSLMKSLGYELVDDTHDNWLFEMKLTPQSLHGGIQTDQKYDFTISNWLGYMSKHTSHIHHLINLYCINSQKYFEIVEKYKDYTHTIDNTPIEQLHKEFIGSPIPHPRLEKAYISCKQRNIDPLKEFDIMKEFITTYGNKQSFALYRTEGTNRFKDVHAGSTFHNATILTTTPNKLYSLDYLTKYNTGRATEGDFENILLIFPSSFVKAVHGKLSSDEHTTYREFENIYSDKVVKENDTLGDEFWIQPTDFDVIGELTYEDSHEYIDKDGNKQTSTMHIRQLTLRERDL